MSAEIQLTFDPEKLEALSYYLAKTHTTPMKELTAALNDLYEKHVPADTREYLERKQPPARPRQKPKKPESHPGKERTADATSGEPEQPPG